MMTLKSARINKNYTQEEASKILNISKYTLSNYEQGKTFPDVQIIKKIEKLYEIKYDDLDFLI